MKSVKVIVTSIRRSNSGFFIFLSSPQEVKQAAVTIFVRCMCVHEYDGFVRSITFRFIHGIQNNLTAVVLKDIDFKKAFDRVWHAALWATMRKYNISANLVRTIEQIYDKATSAVQMNGSIGEWFRTTVGVRQGCLLSPTLFNIFLERIMSDALEEHDGKVSIGGRNITNLRFADDIDALAEEEQELEALVESLDKTCTRYKMEISAEKTKLMTNSANGIQREIRVKGQKLGSVTSFKYLGAVVSDDGSKPWLVGWLFWV